MRVTSEGERETEGKLLLYSLMASLSRNGYGARSQ